MSDSKPDWDALIPLLYKEFWAENEAIYTLAGIKPNESETSFTNLRTGKRVPASEAKFAFKHIFDNWIGDSHPWTRGILYSTSSPRWKNYNKYYYLHWVAQKPFIRVEWLDWAYSEEHLNEAEKHRISKLIDSNVINAHINQESPIQEKQMGDTARKNLLLLIGIMKRAMLDPGFKSKFQDQDKISQWIEDNFVKHGPRLTGRGLSADSVERKFNEANAILKEYGIDPVSDSKK